jgi:hypothetical protein
VRCGRSNFSEKFWRPTGSVELMIITDLHGPHALLVQHDARFSGRVTNQPEKKSAFAEQKLGTFSDKSPSFGENWPTENGIPG